MRAKYIWKMYSLKKYPNDNFFELSPTFSANSIKQVLWARPVLFENFRWSEPSWTWSIKNFAELWWTAQGRSSRRQLLSQESWPSAGIRKSYTTPCFRIFGSRLYIELTSLLWFNWQTDASPLLLPKLTRHTFSGFPFFNKNLQVNVLVYQVSSE